VPLHPKPRWGWLYAAAALALAPFVLAASLVPDGPERTALEVVAGLILIGALARWVRVNRIAIELLGRRHEGWRQATITMAPSARPAHLSHRHELDLSQRRQRATRRGFPEEQDLRHERFVLVPRG
jgi:hypothetical protein